MIFKKLSITALIFSLLISAPTCQLMANQDALTAVPHVPEAAQVTTEAVNEAVKQIPSGLTYIPGGEWLYTETLGKRPGTCLLIVAGFFAANSIHNRYKDYHNNRAKIRSQLWEKIQQECYTFSTKGLSEAAKVRDFSDPNIANALLKKKNDWMRDARGISRWGLLSDIRLVNLIEEFFVVLQNQAANVQGPIAPAPQKAWYNFWSASHGQRLIPNILQDIKECLMGSCG